MRACQLCGCPSWGPLKDAIPAPAVTRVDTFLQCDHCGAMAREDLITEAPLDPLGVDVRRDPFAGPFRRLDAGPDPIVTAQAMLAQVLSSKAPETRLERLIRSVLESGQFAPDALALVTYAKAVEAQMMSGGDG